MESDEEILLYERRVKLREAETKELFEKSEKEEVKKRIIELNNRSSSNQMFLPTSSRFEVCRTLNERCEEEKRGVRTELSSKFPFPRLLLDRFVALSLFKGTKNINWITNGKEVEYLHLEKSNQSNSEKKKKKETRLWTLDSLFNRHIIETRP